MNNNLGLNRQAYFCEKWFAKEQSQVFNSNWSFAGVSHDVKNNGDYVCLKVGNNPIFVIRDDEGQLRAFHNVCRHRGTVMLQGKGNISNAIECGYHCWRYKLNGELSSVPQQAQQFERIDKSQYGLHQAAVRVFNGMIFVHPDINTTVDFDQWIGLLKQHIGPYDISELEEVHSIRHPLKANWKLFIENHIESYHLWYAHKNSILGLDHKAQKNYYANGHWSFFQPTLVPGQMAEFEKYVPSQIIAPNDHWFGSGDHLVYPNLGVVTGAKFIATLMAIPLSATTTEVEIRVFGRFPAEGAPDEGQYYEDGGSSENYNVNQEDIDLCERVQQGMMSDLGGVGALARDFEQSIIHFHQQYNKEIGNNHD